MVVNEQMRRSSRDTKAAQVQTPQVQSLLEKIRTNHEDTVVLKVKDHLAADISSSVLDAIIEALWKNRVCQALYIQNLSKALQRPQLYNLIALFQKKMIWCLNIGENYEIATKDWEYFASMLPKTNITHLYVSEHVISLSLKNKMRASIRENRKKHNKHCSPRNIAVIERCTHCWWNPINSIRHAMTLPRDQGGCFTPAVSLKQTATSTWKKAEPRDSTPWKFSCACREVCSHYENPRYHPVGRMFQCSLCSVWAHVACVLGEHVTDDDIEEMQYVLCSACRSREQRERRHRIESEKTVLDLLAEKNANPARSSTATAPASEPSASQSKEAKKPKKRSNRSESVVTPESEEDWKFNCRCGEVSSSKRPRREHPAGHTFQCTACEVWSHVSCVLGEKVRDEDILRMEKVLCFSCSSKHRRKRQREEKQVGEGGRLEHGGGARLENVTAYLEQQSQTLEFSSSLA